VSVCLVPRWRAGPDDDWYPWLARRLAGRAAVLVVPLAPSAAAPDIDACLRTLTTRLGGVDALAAGALAHTVLVGHSVGAQAALRLLESLPGTAACPRGVVCVAGWWTLAGDGAEPLAGWTRAPLDLGRVRAHARRVVALLGEGDPTCRDPVANAAAWRERLGATVRIVPGAGHFRRIREPAVLEAVGALVG
jgi:predicted alpha/beta hydrolase family esterase